jgi:putative sugar O-methyltransferase
MYLTIENGFEDRNVEVDMKIIRRVIHSFNKAKAAQKNAAEEYQVSYMWLPIYEKFMNKIIEALSCEDEIEVAKIYGNFFREPCSIGLHGMPVDMASTYFSGNISEENKALYTEDLMHRFGIWIKSIGKSCPLSVLDTPVIGNPYGCHIDGKFFRAGVDYQHYYATMISRLVRNHSHKFVLELGGGFGGLAHFLIRDNVNLTYIDVDLPENMALSAFYLLSAFPYKKIALFGEVDLKTEDISQYDALILPNFSIQDMKRNSVDLAFNSYSLAEMSANTVSNYVNHFSRISSKFIYHINHTKNSEVKADDFGFDSKKFELISRAPALWNMARNNQMDEFEYLYKASNLSF